MDVRLGDRYNPLHHVLGRSIGSLFAGKDVLLSCCLARNALSFDSGSEGSGRPEAAGLGEQEAEEAALSRLCRRIMDGLRECKQRLDAAASPSSSSSSSACPPAAAGP